MQSRNIVIIPARLESTRLPGKVLELINGKSMLEHVHSAAVAAHIGPVIVAVEHQRTFHEVLHFGGTPIMTGAHNSGTDRCGEALDRVGVDKYDLIVNLQADIPNITPQAICETVLMMARDPSNPGDIGTLICKNHSYEEMQKTSIVKVHGTWLSSRVLRVTTFNRHLKSIYSFEHVGIYVYRQPVLDRILDTPPCGREISQSLEQLRALELGYTFDAYLTDDSPISVDTPEDLERARKIMG